MNNKNRKTTTLKVTSLLFATLILLLSGNVLAAVTDLSGSSGWSALMVGDRFDPYSDTQASKAGTEIVGNASHPSFYVNYDDNGTTSGGSPEADDILSVRIRIGDETKATHSAYIFTGADVDNDGVLDVFFSSGSGNIAIWDAGSSANTSPSTTSIANTEYTSYANSSSNYNFAVVSAANDPDWDGNDDINSDGNTDVFISFSIQVSDLSAFLATQGITFSQSTQMLFVSLTATQTNSLNSDFNGVDRSSVDDWSQTFSDLGIFSDPVNSGGIVDTTPPANPTVVSQTSHSSTPTITGTYPSTDAAGGFSVQVNSVTYTLGVDSELAAIGDNWTLVIPGAAALSDATYEVTATVSDGSSNSATDQTSNELVIDTQASVNTSTISASPVSIEANGISTSSITVQLKYANGDNLSAGGDSVTLSTTAGGLGSITDNSDGTYTATLTSSTTVSTATISGTVNSVAIVDDAMVDFTVGAASTTTSLISASPTSIIANGSSTSTITVQLRDANGNSLTAGGDNVTLSTTAGSLGSVADNADGTYTATLTSTTNVTTATITGTVNSSAITDSAVVTFVAGPASAFTSLITASPTSITADGSSTAAVTVQLQDASGNSLTSGGDTVTLSTTAGSLGTVTDNGNGTYSATLTSSTTVSTATITGTVNSSDIVDDATVNFTAGAASAATSLISASPTSITADGSSTSTITVQLRDTNNNSLTSGGDTVTLSTTAGSLGTVTDNGNGTYSATLTSSTAVTTATITGTVNSSAIVDDATVNFTAGAASAATSLISASPTSITADGSSTATVTVQLQDTNGNSLTSGGDTVTLSTTAGSLGTVTDNGNGTYSATLTSSTTVATATITGTVNSSSIIDDASVDFATDSASAGTSLITASPTSISADGSSTSTITVQLIDASGNALTAGGDTVTLATDAGSLSNVTDNGDGSYSATLTSSTTVTTATITGSVNSASIIDSASVDFTVGTASVITSQVSASPTSIVADGSSTSAITVQLKDAAGNSLTTGGDTVTLNSTAGSLGSVTDNGDGSYSATLTSSTTVTTATISAQLNGSDISDTATVDFTSNAAADDDGDGISNIDEGSGDSDNDGVPDYLDIDSDNDGIPDSVEGNVDSDGDGIADYLDLDSDNDGLADVIEAGGSDPDADGIMGNGAPSVDADGLVVTGGPLTPVDTDSDGIPDQLDLDSDNDGIPDVTESGGDDADGDGIIGNGIPTVDQNGVVQGGLLDALDTDNDGVPNQRDLDSDNDGIPDVTEAGGDDPDGDGVAGSSTPTVDANGMVQGVTLVPVDSDNDGDTDPYDLDSDNDGIFDIVEAGGIDNNNDGMLDGFSDTNGDGFDDGIAATPLLLPDSDNDGIPDFQDRDDSDNDGIPDAIDLDDDNDGIPDSQEGDGLVDSDGDGVVDSLDLDSDNDGLLDVEESGVSNATLLDSNNDGRIDSSYPVGSNGLADIIETSADSAVVTYHNGSVVDTDGDGVADFRDLDSDNDGIQDVIEAGGSDPDDDGVLGSGTPAVNNNGIAAGSGLQTIDTDGDGIADFRDLDSDGDNIYDVLEAGGKDANNDGQIDGFIDSDGDGFDDARKTQTRQPIDSDGDGKPDYQDVDAAANQTIHTGLDGIGAMNPLLLLLATMLMVPRRWLTRASPSGHRHPLLMFASMVCAALMLIPNTSKAEDPAGEGYKFYIGAALGNSLMNPETTGTIYSISDDKDAGLRLYIGMDFTPRISAELSYSRLGTTTLTPNGTLDYDVSAVDLLYYVYSDTDYSHQGLEAYLKLGMSRFDISSSVAYAMDHSSHIALGAGLEYGLENDLALRVDVESFDEDAAIVSVGLLYRFGQQKPKPVRLDSDKDGVFDDQDNCPATALGVAVDSNGCELDSDQDGVVDSKDECPNTSPGTAVDQRGCDLDSDKDGVIDSQDRCPETPAGTQVDTSGCPNDNDADGVLNAVDQCPTTVSGAAVNAVGCAIFETTIVGVNFKTASAELTDDAKVKLDEAIAALIQFPNVRVEIQAHTDDRGSKKNNQRLSEARAKSVYDYMVAHGIAAEQLQSVGYGEERPIATNDTEEGRAQNRRVEFHVLDNE